MAGAIVQAPAVVGSGTTVNTGSFGSNVTSGNYLWVITTSATADTVAITQTSGTATIGSVTDRGSVTEAGLGYELTHFTIPITGTGSLDLRATFGSSQAFNFICAVEVSGVASVDGDDERTDAGSNPTPNSALTVNVSAQPAFGISFVGFYQGGTPTAGSGWTSYGSPATGALIQTKAITATGNTTAQFGNGTLDRSNSCMVVFTEGGGGSPALDDSGVSPGTMESQSSPSVISIW